MTETQIQNSEQSGGEVAQQKTPERFVAPRARIVETEHTFVVTAEMPGVGRDGVEVSIEDDKLVVVGRRGVSETRGRTIYRESRPANYRRVFDLEGLVDGDKVGARIDNGILRVELQKTESLKPRKIEVA